MELQKELTQQTSLELPATFVFDYPSIGEMCGFISSALPPPQSASTAPPALTSEQPQARESAAASPSAVGQPVWMSMTQHERRQHVDSQV